MRRLHPGGAVAQARRQVLIVDVLRELGVDIDTAPTAESNRRVQCPFSDLHDDRGIKPEMRVYVDNSAWCFACGRRYDSVNLMAIVWDCSNVVAARRLLSHRDGEAEQTASQMPRVHAGMVAALGVWADAQGVDRTSRPYVAALTALDAVASEDAARRWLAHTKRALAR